MATSAHVPFRWMIVGHVSVKEQLRLSVRITRSGCALDSAIVGFELTVEGADEFLVGLTARLQSALQVRQCNTTMFVHAFKEKFHIIQTFLANFYVDEALYAAYCWCLGEIELNVIQLVYEREKGPNGVVAVTTAS